MSGKARGSLPRAFPMKVRDSLKNLIKKLYENDVVRYVFFGGCTTGVNVVSFFLLRKAGLRLNIANLISIILAVLFAYVVNSKYVFQDPCKKLQDHIRPFLKFISARAVTMVIELGGVWLLAGKLKFPEMPGKVFIQVIVLVLNYLFSKFLVFTGNHTREI